MKPAVLPISVKPVWLGLSSHLWILALVLGIVFLFMRAAGTLGSASLRWLLPVGFLVMAVLPWILLTATGRRQIGLRRPNNASFYVVGACTGVLAATVCFLIGMSLFGNSPENWFVSIANGYRQTFDTTSFGLWQLYLIFTLPAIIFSPVGEEIFFRGLLQRALEQQFSTWQSTIAEAGLFAIVHLCHHGLVLSATGFELYPASAAIWVILMFVTALLFAWLRKASDSLAPAILSHIFFNAVMNLFIFTALWAAPSTP
ncbi:CPBP family intramembrane glutamic endopeptidase [Rheinheimera riviphila]|nr:type II CAAX endopeptidase family protein [Rheinheimera riviphila]